MEKLILALVPAAWVVAIAIVAVQNAEPITLQFLMFRSVPLPFGVVLSFCAAGSMVATALILGVFEGRRRSSRYGR